jgi:hypothetical protein
MDKPQSIGPPLPGKQMTTSRVFFWRLGSGEFLQKRLARKSNAVERGLFR